MRVARLHSQNGAALLLLLAALVLLGLSSGWGISYFRGGTGRGFTRETERTMDEIRRALYIQAKVNGVLPPAGPDGDFPAAPMGIKSTDEWSRPWKYQVDPRLLVGRQETCDSLKDGVWGTPVAVLTSDGPRGASDSSDDLVLTLTREQLYNWLKGSTFVSQTPFNWATCTTSTP